MAHAAAAPAACTRRGRRRDEAQLAPSAWPHPLPSADADPAPYQTRRATAVEQHAAGPTTKGGTHPQTSQWVRSRTGSGGDGDDGGGDNSLSAPALSPACYASEGHASQPGRRGRRQCAATLLCLIKRTPLLPLALPACLPTQPASARASWRSTNSPVHLLVAPLLARALIAGTCVGRNTIPFHPEKSLCPLHHVQRRDSSCPPGLFLPASSPPQPQPPPPPPPPFARRRRRAERPCAPPASSRRSDAFLTPF